MRFAPIMRAVLLALPLLVAACSGESEGNNVAAKAPAPKPTGPAPKTPVTDIRPVPGKSPTWLGPRDDAGDPPTPPYGNLLDQPVVRSGDPKP